MTTISNSLPAANSIQTAQTAGARAADGDYKTAGAGHRVKDADGDYKAIPAVSAGALATTASSTLSALTSLSKGG